MLPDTGVLCAWQQPEPVREQLLEYSAASGCVVPPCPAGAVPAPEVHYSFTQPVTPVEPHPLTLTAVQKAADAMAQAEKAGDKEADNRKAIDAANAKIKAVRDENQRELDASNSAL